MKGLRIGDLVRRRRLEHHIQMGVTQVTLSFLNQEENKWDHTAWKQIQVPVDAFGVFATHLDQKINSYGIGKAAFLVDGQLVVDELHMWDRVEVAP